MATITIRKGNNMRGTDIPPSFWYVRSSYDAPTPFYQWHKVKELGVLAYTECGLHFAYPSLNNTFVDSDTVQLVGGDRCTRGCEVPEKVV